MLERECQVLGRRLLRFLDKAVQQHHAFPRHAENNPRDLSISQAAPTSHRPLPTATTGHAERPAEFDLLNVPAPAASWSGRSIFIVPKMAHIAGTSCFASDARGVLGDRSDVSGVLYSQLPRTRTWGQPWWPVPTSRWRHSGFGAVARSPRSRLTLNWQPWAIEQVGFWAFSSSRTLVGCRVNRPTPPGMAPKRRRPSRPWS
jgi:hypothetical protein